MSNSKIDRFNATRPWAFQNVRRLTIEHIYPGHRTCTVELVLLVEPSRAEPRLELRFIDAVEVKIGSLDIATGLRLEIQDITQWQHEGIRFRVFDEESQMISLHCADFKFDLIGYTDGTIN